MKVSFNFWKMVTIGLLLAALLVLFPFFSQFSLSSFKSLLENNTFSTTLETSIIAAFLTSILLVLFGFIGAILLLDVSFFSFLGKNLGVLIIPVTLGNISIAFICKLLLGNSSFFSFLAQGGAHYKFGFLILLQLYQFGLLFVYLFWMQLQNINADKLDFAKATYFSFYQKLKDIYLPHSRNLLILLAAIGFVFSLYEESKITYLFKVSQGTNSELITNWLTRNYQTTLLVNPNYARGIVFDASYIVLIFAIACLMLLFLFTFFSIKKATGLIIYPQHNDTDKTKSKTGKNTGYVFGVLCVVMAVSPLILTTFKISYNFNFSGLGFPLLMTFIATMAASATAIWFGVASRLGWKNLLNSFNQKSLPFFVMLFIILLIPPIVILITGYKWMSIIGYSNETMIFTVWIMGHILLTLPVLGSFVLFNHFRISNNEIDYLQVYKLSKTEIVRFSFFRRFKAEYLLLFIIGYSFIWNEAVLNSLFSDYIPSFVSGMKMLITGRGADYEKAFGYLLVSLVVAIISALIWRYIIEKAQKQLNTEA